MNPEYDELLVLAETLGEVKTKTEKLEAEFSTQARPLEAATNALSAALSGIKALQFHVLDNNLGALSARVEEMRKAVDEQVGVIALELKKADETNAAKAGQEAEALRSQIAALQAQLGALGAQFAAQLERVEFSAKEEAKKLQLIPGPAGAAGASLNPRGTFVDGETYNRLDVVSWLGSSYIAAVDGVTEKPSKNSNQWQVLASRGSGGAGGAGDFGSLAGVAQINQGGTGQTTRAAGLNALLPSQTGNVQYMLLTDGAGTVSWGAQPVAGLPSQTSNSGKLLTTDGTNASWSGAVTVSGSNATVTGTLTTNGNVTINSNVGIIGKSGTGTGGNWRFVSDDGTTRWTTGLLGGPGETSYSIYDSVNSRSLLTATAAGVVQINQTTASTTTSTGALVIGNGTSGGLGVGGAVNVGGTLTVNSTSSFVGNATLQGSALWLNDGGGGTFNFVNGSTVANTLRLGIGNTNQVLITDTKTTILATTASTSTSTGALVVSGGVGIAQALFAGESAYFAGAVGASDAVLKSGFGRSANGNSYLDLVGDTTYTDYGLRMIRGSAGANAISEIVHRGTGDFRITTNEAASLVLRTAATAALTLTSAQQVQVNATTASTSTSSGALVVSGGVGVAGKVTSTALGLANTSQSAAAWGDVGVQLSVAGAVLTDTSSSGTVGRIVTNSIAASALAASSTTTYTAAASLFIAGAPTANTNVTITNAYALYTAGGRINFQGLPTSSAGLQAGTLWNDGGTLKVA